MEESRWIGLNVHVMLELVPLVVFQRHNRLKGWQIRLNIIEPFWKGDALLVKGICTLPDLHVDLPTSFECGCFDLTP